LPYRLIGRNLQRTDRRHEQVALEAALRLSASCSPWPPRSCPRNGPANA